MNLHLRGTEPLNVQPLPHALYSLSYSQLSSTASTWVGTWDKIRDVISRKPHLWGPQPASKGFHSVWVRVGAALHSCRDVCSWRYHPTGHPRNVSAEGYTHCTSWLAQWLRVVRLNCLITRITDTSPQFATDHGIAICCNRPTDSVTGDTNNLIDN